MTPKRNQSEARRIARLAYPYPGCCLCGQTVGEQLSHLDHNAGNNDPDNLAWLCHHHHWMFDIGLFSLAALKAHPALARPLRRAVCVAVPEFNFRKVFFGGKEIAHCSVRDGREGALSLARANNPWPHVRVGPD